MTRRAKLAAATVAAALALAIASSPSAYAATDDVLPGNPLPPSVVSGTLDSSSDPSDVYRVDLLAGETLALSLTTDFALATLHCDLDIYLYGPGTAAGTPVHTSAISRATLPHYYPEKLNYQAPASGTYYVELFAAEGSGPTRLTWAILPEPLLPVYRFYNVRTGTHFYTPSDVERETVIARWSDVFQFEGTAYHTKATKNDQPLHRFYNRRTGSHFYTASEDERGAVLARYGHIFTYEGPTYSVSTAPDGGKAPVYRFYNVRNGSHFFTASLEEANNTIARYGNVYQYEGPAFYLGQ